MPPPVRVWTEPAPDVVARFAHVRPCGRGHLWELVLEGARDGGRFEILQVGVTELDERGRLRGIDIYGGRDRIDQARVRCVELGAAPHDPQRIPPNGAARATSRPCT